MTVENNPNSDYLKVGVCPAKEYEETIWTDENI
jgi:hypothetical protein